MTSHIAAAALLAGCLFSAVEPKPTKVFEIRGDRPYLGGQPVKLWGLRCNNTLLSPAVTERLLNNLDNFAAHGFNMIGVSLQGTNGGFPNVDAGPNGFTPDGRFSPGFAKRLEQVLRAADNRGMVVALGLIQPRKDQFLRDEAAIQNAIETTGRFLVQRKLANVFVNLMHEFNHPYRIDHELLRLPNANEKRAKLAKWWKGVCPKVPCGSCPNHLTGVSPDFPGADLLLFQNDMPVPNGKFCVNMETDSGDQSGSEGSLNRFQIEFAAKELANYLTRPNAGILVRSPYVEDVSGSQGTGPNFEVGGRGTGESDRGIQHLFGWMKKNVGRWEFPHHVK